MTHRRRRITPKFLLAAVVLLTSVHGAWTQGAPGEITVAAAISMKDALEALEKIFVGQGGAAKVSYTFGASGILEKQIEEGAPVDVFISAAPEQLNTLEKKGLLVAGTRRDVAMNRLVLVVPAGTTLVKSVEDLKKPQVRTIAIGEPRAVPAGQYAAEALRSLGLFEALRSKFVYAQNVRAVLAYVEGQDADAGFVYETDARITNKVLLAAPLPASTYTRVVYPAAVIRGSPNPKGARKFVEFLGTAEALAVLEKYGFRAPTK